MENEEGFVCLVSITHPVPLVANHVAFANLATRS